MRQLAGILAAMLVGLGPLCGCNVVSNPFDTAASPSPSTESRPTSTDGHQIELFGWWTRIGESEPLGALMRIHQTRFPNDRMINASAELSGLARKTLHERLMRGEPPDTFQANIGDDLMKWVVVNGVDAAESRLLPLDRELANFEELRRNIPKALFERMSFDGKLYAVPVNVQRINSVFYSKKFFREHGLTEPKSLEDLRTMGDRLKSKNLPLFALGTREPWTLTLFIFECLLVGREGLDFYRDFFRGALQPDDPRIRATLEEALKLLEYANPNHPRLTWMQAADYIINGQAALLVMGDWTRGHFANKRLHIGEDYGEFPFPGSEDAFIFTTDTFSLPRGSRNKEGAKRLLATMASREGQKAMNDARNVLPARLDVPAGADSEMQRKHQLLASGKLAVAFSGLLPGQVGDDLGQAAVEMVAERDIEPVMLTLRSRYALMR